MCCALNMPFLSPAWLCLLLKHIWPFSRTSQSADCTMLETWCIIRAPFSCRATFLVVHGALQSKGSKGKDLP